MLGCISLLSVDATARDMQIEKGAVMGIGGPAGKNCTQIQINEFLVLVPSGEVDSRFRPKAVLCRLGISARKLTTDLIQVGRVCRCR